MSTSGCNILLIFQARKGAGDLQLLYKRSWGSEFAKFITGYSGSVSVTYCSPDTEKQQGFGGVLRKMPKPKPEPEPQEQLFVLNSMTHGLEERYCAIRKPELRCSDFHSDRADSRMMSVVLQQQIRGNWEYSAELLQLLNVSQDEFDKLDMSDDKDVIITLVALCWLQKQFSHRHDESQMIEAKAKAWLSSRHLPSNVEDLIKKTADKLRS